MGVLERIQGLLKEKPPVLSPFIHPLIQAVFRGWEAEIRRAFLINSSASASLCTAMVVHCWVRLSILKILFSSQLTPDYLDYIEKWTAALSQFGGGLKAEIVSHSPADEPEFILPGDHIGYFCSKYDDLIKQYLKGQDFGTWHANLVETAEEKDGAATEKLDFAKEIVRPPSLASSLSGILSSRSSSDGGNLNPRASSAPVGSPLSGASSSGSRRLFLSPPLPPLPPSPPPSRGTDSESSASNSGDASRGVSFGISTPSGDS